MAILEREVHDVLKDYQVKNVKGKEWFICSVSHAMKAIASVISPASEIDSVPDGKGEEEECFSPTSAHRGWEGW